MNNQGTTSGSMTGTSGDDAYNRMSGSEKFRYSWVFNNLDQREVRRFRAQGFSDTDIRGAAHIAMASGLPMEYVLSQYRTGGAPLAMVAMDLGVARVDLGADIPGYGMNPADMGMAMYGGGAGTSSSYGTTSTGTSTYGTTGSTTTGTGTGTGTGSSTGTGSGTTPGSTTPGSTTPGSTTPGTTTPGTTTPGTTTPGTTTPGTTTPGTTTPGTSDPGTTTPGTTTPGTTTPGTGGGTTTP
jgi:hypothetical protein